MTTRATDVIGKPVISAEGGEKLGTVADLLLDDAGHGLVGLVVRHGMLKSEKVLPAEAVQSFGRDAVMSRTSELVSARDWQAAQDTLTRTDEETDPRKG